ncbi:MAG: hypothetical protein ACRD3P_09085 [Terriglobales bacterium]
MRIALQREWLLPPAEVQQERDNYVSSFHYDPATTCFEIGNGNVGVHVSSFTIQGRGSANAAAGRDIFFLVDLRARKMTDHLDLGITKQRIRSQGCWNATMVHFVVADINGDGLADIGVVREEILCSTDSDTQSSPVPGPVYRQFPAVWYVTSGRRWQIDGKYTGELPGLYTELPLIGMTLSPVDFVGGLLWHTYDSGRWPHTGDVAFVPGYKRLLFQGSRDVLGGATKPDAWVEMAYCGAKPQKPPLQKLLFQVLFRNPSDEPRWILLPSTLYTAPTQPAAGAGVSGVELLADDHGTKLVKFLGTASADPTDSQQGGGFQAILLAAKTNIKTDVVVDYWGRPERPLAITAIIARQLTLNGKAITHYFHSSLLTNSSSAATSLRRVETWNAPELREVPVTVAIVERRIVKDALAIPCPDDGEPTVSDK